MYPLTAVPAIVPWHESPADTRVLSGPNGGGKTTAGAFEVVSYACGFNPIRNEKYATPNLGWAVCLTLKGQGRRMLRALTEMLPRKANGDPNWRWWKQEGLISVGSPYNSEIYIKQQEDGKESFYGERCKYIWIDEEKAGETGIENFNEMLAREMADEPLRMLITYTPENGLSWLWQRVWNQKSETYLPGVFALEFSLYDCSIEKGGFWPLKQIEKKAAQYDEYERAARLFGKSVPFGNRRFFNTAKIMDAMEHAPTGVRVTFHASGLSEDGDSDCQRFRPPESGHEYIAAWDPGSGSGGDYSALVVFDRSDLALVFQAKNNRMDPEYFASRIALPAASYYHEALLAVEVNGEGGGAAVQATQSYRNNYIQRTWDKTRGVMLTDKVGWRTTEPSRHRIMDALSQTLREAKWTPSRELLDEMSHVVIKQLGSGRMRAEHADGFHDDLVMAAGIALAIHYEEPFLVYPPWAKLRMVWKDSPDNSPTLLPLG